MLRKVVKENKKLGFTYKDYYLPQGDSFTLTATESGSAGEGELISGVVFKLGQKEAECKLNLLFQQEFVKSASGIWVCKVSGDETAKWLTTCENCETPYVYEIEIYYSDGEPITLTSGNFYVEPQIKGEA